MGSESPSTEQCLEQEQRAMRTGLRFNNPRPDRLTFARQLGVEDIIVHPYEQSYIAEKDLPLPTDRPWSVEELAQLQSRIEDRGLRLRAIENLPLGLYEDVMLDGESASEQLAGIKTIVRNMGRVGISTLGYNWMPSRVWRTSQTAPGRGGAESTAFKYGKVRDAPPTHDRVYSESELWDNYRRFLDEVLPVAEEAGVTLALHPDDPPVDALGGIPRLFTSLADLQRAMAYRESDAHAIQLCLGTISEMEHDASTLDVIEAFGSTDDISYVHFRDVEGTVPEFQEVFIDEGNYDEIAALSTLADVGFTGTVIPDHVPKLVGEDDWHPSGRSFTVGYIRGALRTLSRER